MLGKAIQPEIGALIAERRFEALREQLEDLEVADVAEILEDLPSSDAAVVFRVLPRRIASDVFERLPFEDQERVIREMSQETLGAILNAMDPDDRTQLLEELPAEVTRRLLKTLKPEELRVARTLLGYPEESIGRLMTPEYFAARPEWTVEETAERIREVGGEVETVLYLYIVDEKGRLIDDVHIARLVMARPGTKLAELVDDSFVSLSAFDDREVAVAAFKKYDRFILPVVDRAGVLLGIVTVDDVLDVEEEEATEDVHLFGGQAALEHPYFSARPIEMLRKRAGWLTFLFASGSLTAFTISQFEDLLQRIVTLAFFIPLVISTGGNSGSQSASMIIRGLAIREIDMADWRRVFRRELSIGLTLGALLGLLLGGFILASIGLGAIEQGPAFAVVAMVSVTAIVTLGALLGGLMPFFFKRIGFDPATSSAPCISTIMDVSGTLLYLGLAAALMSVI